MGSRCQRPAASVLIAPRSSASELAAHLDQYRASCERIIERRNKRIAHHDFDTQRAASTEGMSSVSRQEIEQGLAALREFMRAAYQFFEQSYMAYEHFAMLDDANSVLRIAGESLR